MDPTDRMEVVRIARDEGQKAAESKAAEARKCIEIVVEGVIAKLGLRVSNGSVGNPNVRNVGLFYGDTMISSISFNVVEQLEPHQ